MWDQLEKMMMGSKIGNQMKVANCINNYEEFKAKEGESLEATYDRFVSLLNDLSKNKVKKQQMENNVKFLSILQPKQNEEDVEEIIIEKKKYEKIVPDLVALVVERKEKKKKKKMIISDSGEVDSVVSNSDDEESLKQAMILMNRAFQKKFYKKSGSNSQRYSFGSQNYEQKERIEGKKRYEDKKDDDQRYEKKYVNRYEEKKPKKLVKCYNRGKIGHYAKDCRKPKVLNSYYYKNKMQLAKQKEAGKALMAKDDH
ncbi:hypothetical protein L6452_06262 [Arctium lappa]|uniref:Uncharacterized protein n=1 Tax=Arctium lappa TaxID=4217 RepID=A0ACB9EJ08_ARCLA|nr:hypothetical protein L6452_06262 [Arctium lappa]